MNLSTKFILAIIVIGLAFAAGRYSVSVDKQTQIDQTTKTKTDTTIVVVKEPNGKETTTTSIKERETTKKELNQTETPKKAILNVSLLGSYNYEQNTPSYGVSVTKEFIGPVTLGAFGLTNGTIGLSIGVNF